MFVERTVDVPLILELHSSMYTDKLLEFKVKDLLPDGILAKDLSKLKAESYIESNLKNFHYTIFPETKNFYNSPRYLSGYYYLKDVKGKMKVIHREPVPVLEPPVEASKKRTSRFLTSTD